MPIIVEIKSVTLPDGSAHALGVYGVTGIMHHQSKWDGDRESVVVSISAGQGVQLFDFTQIEYGPRDA